MVKKFKKKDQQALRGIIILVVVLIGLGLYLKSSDGGSPFSKASEPPAAGGVSENANRIALIKTQLTAVLGQTGIAPSGDKLIFFVSFSGMPGTYNVRYLSFPIRNITTRKMYAVTPSEVAETVVIGPSGKREFLKVFSVGRRPEEGIYQTALMIKRILPPPPDGSGETITILNQGVQVPYGVSNTDGTPNSILIP